MTVVPDLDLAAEMLGALAERDVGLGPYCTYRVGGPAALWVEVSSVEDLELVRQASSASGCPVLVVGKGSNLLVCDAGFPGIVVHLGEAFAEVTINTSTAAGTASGSAPDETEVVTVIAGGAAFLPVVARRTAAAGLTGFEWAVGVPGSIGGAVRMNAGGHGSDMAACLVRVSVFDFRAGGPVDWSLDDLELGYRRSALRPHQIVLHAELALQTGEQAASEQEISEIVRWRRANQPGGQNAGSVFANPPDDSAGRIIDSLGLKGLRVGTAEVSEKHANFIQADPDGSADDVYRLIEHIKRRVYEETGIELLVENRLIGFETGEPSPDRHDALVVNGDGG